MSRGSIDALRSEVTRLIRTERYAEAREAALVAADAAEAGGLEEEAWLLRTGARRLHVLEWARKTYEPDLRIDNVQPQAWVRRAPRRGRRAEVRRFKVYFTHGNTGWTLLTSVSPRGRITILEPAFEVPR